VGFDGSTPTLQALTTGQVDVAQNLGTGTLLSAVSRGRELVAVSSSITTNHLRLYSRPDSGIATLADLRGRKVGVLSLQSETQLLLEAAAREDAGLSPQDVQYVAVGNGLDAFEMLANGNIEALYTGDDNAVRLQQRTPVVEVPSTVLKERGFITATVVDRAKLTEDRDLLVRYGRAWAQGVVFANANPEAAVRIHWEQFPQSKPVGVSDEQALATATEQLRIRLAHLVPFGGLQGDVDPAAIQGAVDMLAGGAYLEGGPVPVDRFWSSDLLKEINTFDVAAVQEEARSWPSTG
jgi:NitT/TauT family transport system substrate-binding protein